MNRGGRLLLGVSLIGPLTLATGCLPYAYPKLSYVPGAELGPEVSDVHAFRVDAATDLAMLLAKCEYKLTEITPRAGGTVPSQLRVTIERAVAHPTDQFYFFSGGCFHETLVRLYRPGFLLVELKSWDSTDKIVWQPAPDWRSQQQALIGLLASPRLTPTPSAHGGLELALPTTNPSLKSHKDWDHYLPLAPATLQTQQVFDVAVAECERLAKCAPTTEDAARVSELAEKLIERKSAAGKSKK